MDKKKTRNTTLIKYMIICYNQLINNQCNDVFESSICVPQCRFQNCHRAGQYLDVLDPS